MDQSWMGIWLILCSHLLLFYFSFSHSLCHPHDSSSLLQFKSSFTIINATYYDPRCPDTLPKSATWKNGTDCCFWPGVTCHPISGHVTGLNLGCSRLQFKLHPNNTIFHLSHLTHLNLSFSRFEGQIPSSISHLSKLESLDLSFNYELMWEESTWERLLQNTTVLKELVLDGTNMSSVSTSPLNLSSSLVTLSLSNTGLRKNFTKDILCLPNLQHLYLSGFSDNFNLQEQFPNLSCSSVSLSILDLSSCQLQGPIPPHFSNLTKLTSLDLSFNNLNGSIPSSLLSLPFLSHLDLRENHLSGEIPNVFHHLNKYEELDFSNNNIGGEIPSTLANLQHLTHLYLSRNKFSGQIPSSLFNLPQLSSLLCDENRLEGPLPSKITGFSNMTILSFHDNLLNGTIPPWCLSLPSLEVLKLSKNQFTGYIGAISSYSLWHLDLCNNKLEGNIPESISFLVNLNYLCLSSNKLSGPVNFSLFSELYDFGSLSLSQNDELTLDFKSNYSFPHLWNLELSSMGLTEFPKLLGKFPVLTSLQLSNNKLNGTMPNWLHEMSFLSYLNLSGNLLTASMDEFSRNYELRYLDLSSNLLDGGISSSICNTSNLVILSLSHNKLKGVIPQCLANLPHLNVLNLQVNKLQGSIPDSFSKNNQLITLNLNDNQLDGLIPGSLENCTSLEVLNLGNNQIEDTFPHWLQTLPYLKVLVLRGNKLHGPIATLKTMNPFPNLVIFDISSNSFNGPIPKAYIEKFEAMKNLFHDEVVRSSQYTGTYIGATLYPDSLTITTKSTSLTFNKLPKKFSYIGLSENKFEGEIPDVIGDLQALRGLNLSHNRLRGPIPQSIGNLTYLESLDLCSNMLTGRIPVELTNLNFLADMNVSYNNLVGEIPQGKQFNTFMNDSYQGNLELCGSPLSKRCGKEPELDSPCWREEGFGFGWKPVAIGFGCGVILGVGLGSCVLLTGKPRWLARMVRALLN